MTYRGANVLNRLFADQPNERRDSLRSRAHAMSRLAGAAFDAAEELGWELQTLRPTEAAVQSGEVACVFSIEDGQVMATSVIFRIEVKRNSEFVKRFLERRSSALKYGKWTLLELEVGSRIALEVRISDNSIDGESFATVAKYMEIQIVAMRDAILEVLRS